MASYPSLPIPQAINDARDIRSALTDLGFQVEEVEDATLARLTTTIETFKNDIHEGDTVLVYYSGHGFDLEGESQLVPIDYVGHGIETVDEGQLSLPIDDAKEKESTYGVGKLLTALREKRPLITIAILDACRNNVGGIRIGKMRPGGMRIDPGTPETFFASATSGDDIAKNGNSNGLFTSALLQELGRPALNLAEIFEHVTKIVQDETDGRQIPFWRPHSTVDTILRDSTQAKYALAVKEEEKAQYDKSHRSVLSPEDQRQLADLISEEKRRQNEIEANEEMDAFNRNDESSFEYGELTNEKTKIRAQIGATKAQHVDLALTLEDARRQVSSARSAIQQIRDHIDLLKDQEMKAIDGRFTKAVDAQKSDLTRTQFETSIAFTKRKQQQTANREYLNGRWAREKSSSMAFYSQQMSTQQRSYEEEITNLTSRLYPARPLTVIWRQYNADANTLILEAGSVLYRFEASPPLAEELHAIVNRLLIESEYRYFEKGAPASRENVTLVDPRGLRLIRVPLGGSDQDYWQRNLFEEFEEATSVELDSGVTLRFIMQHPHPIHNVHPVTIGLNRKIITFDVLRSGLSSKQTETVDSPPSNCDLEHFSRPLSMLVSSEVITNKHQELLLVLRFKTGGESSSIQEFEFADQFATKGQWVSKGVLGVGIVRRKIVSRSETMRALTAIKDTINRAAAQARTDFSDETGL